MDGNLSEVDASSGSIDVLDTTDALSANATIVSLGELTNPNSAEQWEGVLLTVENVQVAEPSLGYGEWSITSAGGEDSQCIVDDAMYDAFADFEHTAGDTYASITGILHYGYDAYKIEPRDIDDFVGYTSNSTTGKALMMGDLSITEIMYNPESGEDFNCEWFEVHNNLSEAVDLIGLTVSNLNPDGTVDSFKIRYPTVIEAGSYGVIAKRGPGSWDASEPTSYCNAYAQVFTPTGYFGSDINLGNDKDEILTLDYVSESATETIAIAPTFNNPTEPGVAWQASAGITNPGDTANAANWCAATDAIGETGDFGTPGTANTVSCD